MTLKFSSQKEIKRFFKKHSIFPSKKLGQNFLLDKTIIKKIVKTANINQNDFILEIGPGLGNLTQELAKKAKKVIVIEKDQKIAKILKKELKSFSNLKIILADVRKIEEEKLKIKNPYKIVANLPFYLANFLIRKFLEANNPPKEMVLVIQKEVGQRICAQPPKMNLLAVSVQFYAKPEIIDFISKKAFWPQPKVESVILKISNIKKPLKTDKNLFFKLVKAGFSQPRKTLVNNLSKKLNLEKEKIKKIFEKNNLNFFQRPENLTLRNWQKLTKYFSTII